MENFTISVHGLPDSYVKWFCGYPPNLQPSDCIFSIFSLPFKIFWGVLHVFINNLCSVNKHSNYLLFADDATNVCAINSVDDCILLQSVTERIQDWCTANFMKLNSRKTTVITCTSKTSVIILINYRTLL